VDFEQLGLLGVFIFGAIPWFEAIVVVPAAIIFGSPPVLTVIFGVAGNTLTIFLFAYLAAQIRRSMLRRRKAKGKEGEAPRFQKAQRSFDKWGIYGLAALGPLVIGTQFAALVAVAAGVKPLKTSIVISVATLFWATLLAVVFVVAGLDGVPGFDSEG